MADFHQQRFNEYLTVGEAAEFLGVSPWTLRKWDNNGKLKTRRHPQNGYRIYRSEDLEVILRASDSLNKPLDGITARTQWNRMDAGGHFVQFYESDDFLVDAVSNYVASALISREVSLLIVTEAHRIKIEEELKARGLEVSAAGLRGRYVTLDAFETLEKFMVEGSPDPERFSQIVGAVIDHARSGGRLVRVFGEMVLLLWMEGNKAAALRLEELWNDLGKSHHFSLLCAYPLHGFAGEANGNSFQEICACHSRVMPAESYSSLASSDERLREISLLQQRAGSLEVEVASRVRLENALSKSEQRFRRLMELLPAAVCMCEAPSGEIQYYNRRAAELWGREPVLGSVDERFCGSLRLFQADGIPIKHAQCPMAAVLAGGPPVRDQEVVIERPDGSRIDVVVNIDPVFNASGQVTGAVNVFQDVTLLKKGEEELRQAKSAAEEANKAKDHFLAVLSHELRTPLTPVLFSVSALESEPDLSPRIREKLTMIRRNIALETRLIDDLLDLSRIINGKLTLQRQDTHVHPLIKDALQMVDPDVRARHLTVEMALNAKHDRVNADSARLHQVFWNLLHNAIKFTPENGRIRVSTRNEASGCLIIQVEDTGIGIDPEALPTIFNAFDQGEQGATRRTGGLDLGLAIAKAVVNGHEGVIRAYSDGRSKGSCFTVELPTAAEITKESAQHIGAERKSDDERPGTWRILVVEDHLDTSMVLKRLLETFGYAVQTASCVADALCKLDSEDFDLLVSDLELPDGTGLDIMAQARLRRPELRGIALTGFGMERDLRSSYRAGFDAHLIKPADIAQLKATIQDLLSRKEASINRGSA